MTTPEIEAARAEWARALLDSGMTPAEAGKHIAAKESELKSPPSAPSREEIAAMQARGMSLTDIGRELAR